MWAPVVQVTSVQSSHIRANPPTVRRIQKANDPGTKVEVTDFHLFYVHPSRSHFCKMRLEEIDMTDIFDVPPINKEKEDVNDFVVHLQNIGHAFEVDIPDERCRSVIVTIPLRPQQADLIRNHVDTAIQDFIQQHPAISGSGTYKGVLVDDKLMATMEVTNSSGEWRTTARSCAFYRHGHPIPLDSALGPLRGRRIQDIRLQLIEIRTWENQIRVNSKLEAITFS